jgi:orotidine-5'-phosphate decarboxylase
VKSLFLKRLKSLQERRGFLCVGLDPTPELVPEIKGVSSAEDTLIFLKGVIKATQSVATTFKPNLAFYEAMGSVGLDVLGQVISFIRRETECLCLLDSKRGDIDNTARRYAFCDLDFLGADGVTVNPYMGGDAVAPFVARIGDGKGVFVLAETSNPSASDFQTRYRDPESRNGTTMLSVGVAEKAQEWGVTGIVVGATILPGHLYSLRQAGPDLVWLVPGIGAQGGEIEPVMRYGFTDTGLGPVVNAGRSILGAWKIRPEMQPMTAIRQAAIELNDQLWAAKAKVDAEPAIPVTTVGWEAEGV